MPPTPNDVRNAAMIRALKNSGPPASPWPPRLVAADVVVPPNSSPTNSMTSRKRKPKAAIAA